MTQIMSYPLIRIRLPRIQISQLFDDIYLHLAFPRNVGNAAFVLGIEYPPSQDFLPSLQLHLIEFYVLYNPVTVLI